MMGLCRSDVGLGYTEMAMQKLALMGLHTFFHINVFAKVCGSEGVHPYFPPYPEATEHDRCRMGSASAKWMFWRCVIFSKNLFNGNLLKVCSFWNHWWIPLTRGWGEHATGLGTPPRCNELRGLVFFPTWSGEWWFFGMILWSSEYLLLTEPSPDFHFWCQVQQSWGWTPQKVEWTPRMKQWMNQRNAETEFLRLS